jgi:hypothetical protein
MSKKPRNAALLRTIADRATVQALSGFQAGRIKTVDLETILDILRKDKDYPVDRVSQQELVSITLRHLTVDAHDTHD